MVRWSRRSKAGKNERGLVPSGQVEVLQTGMEAGAARQGVGEESGLDGRVQNLVDRTLVVDMEP